VYITVWDRDVEDLFIPYDMVDEFNFDFTDEAGLPIRGFKVNGVRNLPKSQLYVEAVVECPRPLTTTPGPSTSSTPTTPTTTTTTTTPVPTTTSTTPTTTTTTPTTSTTPTTTSTTTPTTTTEKCEITCDYATGAADCSKPDDPYCLPKHCLDRQTAEYCPRLCNYCTTTTPTTTTTTTPTTTTTTPTTTTTTTAPPTTTPLCARTDGCNTLSLKFIRYDNPTDEKATNIPCDFTPPGGLPNHCDLQFDICISELDKE